MQHRKEQANSLFGFADIAYVGQTKHTKMKSHSRNLMKLCILSEYCKELK